MKRRLVALILSVMMLMNSGIVGSSNTVFATDSIGENVGGIENDAPVSSMSIDKALISEGETVTITLEMNEGYEAKWIYLYKPITKNTVTVFLDEIDTGIYAGTLNVDGQTESGIWQVQSLTYTDHVTSFLYLYNSDTYSGTNYDKISFKNLEFEIVGTNADVTSPVLVDFSIDKNVVSAGEKVKLSVTIEEDNPNSNIDFWYNSPSGEIVTVTLYRVPDSLTYEGFFEISEETEQGVWKPRLIWLKDQNDNLNKVYNSKEYSYQDGAIDLSVLNCEVIEAHAHEYSSEWTIDKEPTCIEEGKKSHHCLYCGDVKDVTTIEKKDHVYDVGVVTTEPTLTSEGIKTYTCSICGTIKTESIPQLESVDMIASGECGDDLTWRLAKDGTLTISGTGEMYDYVYNDNPPPWKDMREKIYNLVIEDGVETIGTDAFFKCENLEGEIFFPDSITSIGDGAFSYCDSIIAIRLSNNVGHMYLTDMFRGTSLRHIVYNGTYEEYTRNIKDSLYANEADRVYVSKVHYDTSKIEYSVVEEGIRETCTENGRLDQKECPVCGMTVALGIYTKPTGHVWEEEYTIDKTATENEPGIKSIHCSVCDSIKENSEEVIPSLTGVIAVGTCGSDLNWTLMEDGLLTIGGSGTRLDGASAIRESQWEGYNIKKVIVEEGIKTICEYAFSNCKTIEQIELPSSLQHIGNEAFYGCNNLDKITVLGYKCDIFDSLYTFPDQATLCGYANSTIQSYAEKYDRKFEMIICNGHNYGEWIVDKESTCAKAGSKHKECSVCGNIVTEEIETLSHDFSDGQCNVCSCFMIEKGITSTFSISTIWNVYEFYGETDDTIITVSEGYCAGIEYVENGYKYIYHIDIMANDLGNAKIDLYGRIGDSTLIDFGELYVCSVEHTHVWNDEYTVDKEPTCIDEGLKSIHCAKCNEVKDVVTIEKIDHTYDTWYVVTESTTTVEGLEQRDCIYCDAYETRAREVGAWKKDSTGWWYQLPDGSYLKNCWKDDDGSRYHFNSNGYMDTGWLELDNKWYYLGTNGALQAGWIKVDGIWYYGDLETGALLEEEWLNDTYYFKAGGAMAAGWTLIGTDYYYFNTSGAKVTNAWVGNYWLGADGIMATNAWVDGRKYYVDANGVYKKGWLELDDTWYYLGTDGKLQKGWIKVSGVWYYGDSTTGALLEEEWLDNTYYFKAGGAMVTGWYMIDGDYYYFKSSGEKVTNTWIGNYYLKEDGVMATSEWVDGGKYYVDANGVWVPNAVK